MSGKFTIPVFGLKPGRHIYEFEINKEFFDKFDRSEIEEGELNAEVEAEKKSSHIELVIRISGKVRIVCDRCLEMFYQAVKSEDRLVVKFGKVRDDSDPDILTIPAEEQELDMDQYFYEFIHLALPIKRVHPDDSEGNSTCDPGMLKKLSEHTVEEPSEEDENDPRWDELRKLMNNN
jgi:uncharacterized metal-binding protein YceD (DUF177 family)